MFVKKTKNNIAVCGCFVVCFVVEGIVVCLLDMVFFNNQLITPLQQTIRNKLTSLLFIVCCSLVVVSLLFIVCCLLFAGTCLLFVGGCYLVCCLLFVV